MEIGKLTVQSRNDTGKGVSRQLRAKGLVPGVCYGAGLDAPLSISVDPRALKASLDPLKRQNTVITLTVEGDTNAQLTAMLWNYQIHAIRREVTHVDLLSIDPNKAIQAEVPIEFAGRPKGFVDGGQLNTARHSVEVKAKPADLPARIVLDISELDIGEVLHVSDLPVTEGVEMVTPLKLTVVLCAAPKAEKVVETEEVVEGAEGAAEGAPAADKPAEGGAKEG